MFEILHDIVQEIAKEPTKHSWAVQIMKLNSDDADIAMDRVANWITRMMEILHPEADQAERLVRIIWPNLLEAEALQSYKDKNNSLIMSYVPIVYSPVDAVYVASFDVMGVTDEDAEAATDFLQLMQSGDLAPSMPIILAGLREEIIKDEEDNEEVDEEEELTQWEKDNEWLVDNFHQATSSLYNSFITGLDPEMLLIYSSDSKAPIVKENWLEDQETSYTFIEKSSERLSESIKELFNWNCRIPNLDNDLYYEQRHLSAKKDRIERKIDRVTQDLADTMIEIISLCNQLRIKSIQKQE